MKKQASGMHALGTAGGRVVLALNRSASRDRYALFSCREHREDAILRGQTQAIDDGDAVRNVLAELRDKKAPAPVAVGHRLLYGGGADRAAQVVDDDDAFASLAELVSRAPLQFGLELSLLHTARSMLEHVPHVACFDDAFHATIPEVAFTYALPDEMRELGVRRFGFHGLAFEHAVDSVGAQELGRALLFHLGATASIAAVRNGTCLDTTMGLTPLGGLVMGARPGDLDPGVVLFLLRHGYEPRALERIFSERAGVSGIAGESDVTALVPRLARDPRSALAFELFVRSAQKSAGALATVLSGIDSIVFMGEAGESSLVRDEICHGLVHLGVTLDPTKNRGRLALADGGAIVSTEKSSVTVRVLYADEERMIARHTYAAVAKVATPESTEAGERSRSSR
jgi:acetate kinase